MKLRIILTLLLLIVSALAITHPAHAYDLFGTSCKNVQDSPICQQAAEKPHNPLLDTIHTATTILALVGGAVAVIIIIVSGLSMVTSSGNEQAVKDARQRIQNALIGLVIIALAWSIITFVTSRIIK
jgi:amino acid transporter